MSRCKACDEPLVLGVDDDQGDDASPDTVPDDLQLGCGCHFHWECLMEEASAVALSLKCPSCESFLAVNRAGPSSTNPFLQSASGTPILARYNNEGGVQEQLDIFPSITEEAYLQNNPEARPARALHIMCSEGDVNGVVELLQRTQDQVSDVASLVRYQDPLAEMKSGLHLAVEKGHEEVVWLLLWLSSTMATESFPMPARNAAESMGLGRLSVQSDGDIRGLQDGRGRTAEHIAQERPGSWSAILQVGALSP
ncbi:zinc finger domain-containing protein [Hirsutella rhossiliensis]|uniref:Zinc finger domain-containing protein n=1 Tax=Hirsutella rhossiliensis TaxID=111463 RepID=A0A9P8N7L7_9HYPO|nr:zinc finger domain-containing protein [Hirsutella rhossiliensis]KAH0967451.1 zinc finger domain-containing protein [Hirsutella rhossiliensis]